MGYTGLGLLWRHNNWGAYRPKDLKQRYKTGPINAIIVCKYYLQFRPILLIL
jgi:hypothetical protein